MSGAVVLRRPHVTLEKGVYYGSPNDWSMVPYNYDVVEEKPAKRRSPYVVCVHHHHHHHHHHKTYCSCVEAESRRKQWAIEASANASYGEEWQLQQQQLQPYPYNYNYHPVQQASNQVMVVPATPRPYRPPSAYAQPVYQDSMGRFYTVDAYGKSKWL